MSCKENKKIQSLKTKMSREELVNENNKRKIQRGESTEIMIHAQG